MAVTEWTVREAAERDVAVLVDFNRRLALETESKRLDGDRLERGVRALLSDPRRGRYFVACDGERVVGQMMHTSEWSDWRNGDIWWLQSVYVLPDWRRRGVFRGLYRHLLALAESDTQVVGLRLYVEQSNVRAQQTYRELGLCDAGYQVMERMLRS